MSKQVTVAVQSLTGEQVAEHDGTGLYHPLHPPWLAMGRGVLETGLRLSMARASLSPIFDPAMVSSRWLHGTLSYRRGI